MLYMLDTNICIYLMKKKPLSYFEQLEKLHTKNSITISAIVLAELQYGVANSQHKEQGQHNLNVLLSRIDVMPYTERCTFYYGEIRTALKQQGCIIGGNDLLIASHVLAEDATLVTNNTNEFKRVTGLKIEEWNNYS